MSDEPEQLDALPRETLEGVIERIVFESGETGFVVGRLQPAASSGTITFVGEMLAVSEGETARMRGYWEENPRFGKQFRVTSFETILPATVQGIEKYLGSGLIGGIGPVYARRLVEAFGVETLRVIDEEPARLRSVPGIGRKRAAGIREAWSRHKAIQSIMIFLQGHGVTTSQSVRIYRQYGDRAVAVLRDNPYRLADDISGIAFRGADKIAAELSIEKDAPVRLEAGMAHVLRNAAKEGHLYLPEEELRGAAAELLGVTPDALLAVADTMAAEGRIIREVDRCYLPVYHTAESGCDTLLKRFFGTPSETVPIRIEKALEWVEKQHNITLAPEQREAIRRGVEEKALVITGGPGTGKTTVLNSLLAILEKKNASFALAAPTGRAARRMEEATGRESRTIHRLLEFSPKTGTFTRNEAKPLNVDLLVIDEVSMVDIQLFHALLKALPLFARLILVGDVDQLPSVGPGNVLFDLIASRRIPVVRLETVFRQRNRGGIVENAHRINRGEFPEFNKEDFFLIERHDPESARDTILELMANRMPSSFGLDPMRDIQVLSPLRKGAAGVESLNQALQDALNPKGAHVPRRNLRRGDRVMQLRNNYDLDVYNGDTGIITLSDEDAGELEVTFDDGRRVIYGFDGLDDLGLAYAATVHKAQGSEYPAVILAFLPQHYMMLQRNVLYTAVTRARRMVVIVGDKKAAGMAVRNNRQTRRNTRLAERLRNAL
jgi:exodeoxyribonuclease V alpha subunit